MRTPTRVKQGLLHWGARSAALFTILFLLFSPFGHLLETRTVQAVLVCPEAGYAVSTDRGYPYCLKEGTTDVTGKPPKDDGKPASGSSGLGCNILWPSTYDICLTNLVYGFFVGIGSGFAYAGAYVFNLAVKLSITSTAYGLDFLTTSWVMVRDMANMAFILILIYIAVTVMLEANTGKTMQMLAGVIAIALVINFSFFITRVVIDTGNIAAVQFYNAIPNQSISQTAAAGGIPGAAAQVSNALGTGANTKDLTASIMNGLKLQTILGGKSFEKFRDVNNPLTTIITLSLIYILIGLMLFLLAAMFLFAGIKFIVRTVALWFIIIASPIAFVAYAIPNKDINKYFSQWLQTLFSYAFYPVIFLFIFFVISLVMGDLGKGGGIIAGIFDNLSKEDGPTGLPFILAMIAEVAIRLGIVAAMLYMGLKVSKTGSDYGAQAAGWVTGKIPGFGGLKSYQKLVGTTVGTTIARPATALITRPIGKVAYDIDKGLGRARWSSRGPLSGVATGFREGVLQPISKTSFFGAKSQADKEKQWDEKEHIGQAKKLTALKEKERSGTLSLEEKKEKDGLITAVKRFNKSQIESLKAKEIEGIVAHITESQKKIIDESDKFSTDDKVKLEQKYHQESVESSLRKANKSLEDLIKINKKISPVLQIPNLDDMLKSGKHINAAVLAKISDALDINLDAAKADHRVAISAVDAATKSTGPGRDAQVKIARDGLAQAEANLRNTQNAVEKTKSADTERKKVPSGAGGHDNEGEFIKI